MRRVLPPKSLCRWRLTLAYAPTSGQARASAAPLHARLHEVQGRGAQVRAAHHGLLLQLVQHGIAERFPPALGKLLAARRQAQRFVRAAPAGPVVGGG